MALNFCRRAALILLAAGFTGAALAEEVAVCFNYGCLQEAAVSYPAERLAALTAPLAAAPDAAAERQALAGLIGDLLAIAGEQTPIGADRGGNVADAGVYGRMDCIDHATTTTRLLAMLAARGDLRWHRVIAPQVRSRLLFFEHWSAAIEELAPPAGKAAGEAAETGTDDGSGRYAVDSWFYDNGAPAAVMPLAAWMNWENPIDY